MARKIISCQSCGARFDVSKFPTGSRVKCGRCQAILTVPPDDAPGAPPQPQAPSASVSRAAVTGMRSGSVVAPTVSPSGPGVPAPATAPGGPGTRSGPMVGGPAAPGAPPAPSPPPAGSPEDPLVGKVIHGQYRLTRKLGEGGYGAVYEAKDVHLERRVAIKIMLQARAQSREYVAKFLREARTAAQLTHPNVVAVHGVGFDRDCGVHFLAMEYVEGRTFHDILQERGPLPSEEACNLIIQSCRGLHAAHERNIIHRDIKPGNLMLTPGGAVKITDFGLAKVYDEAAAQSTVIGTPYFMPPEQFEGKARDGRTDIYALGVTFYYMLTMQRPHTGAGPAQILLSVMTKEPVSILEHRPDLPEGLWPIVRRMIQRDLDKRYASCAEIITDLERLLGGGEDEVEKLYCPACGVPNDLDASTCHGCGESLQEKCPVCGATDAAGTKFCGDCGSNIPLERAVTALLDEAQGFLSSGRLTRAREKLLQAQERSAQNMRVAQLLREYEIRRENRDGHRDAVRELLARGRPQEALERWKSARNEFPDSTELSELETDVRSALAARETAGAATGEAISNARALEADGRIREALVAWRGVLILLPGSEDAVQGERRTLDRIERADALAAEAADLLQRGDAEGARDRLAEASGLLSRDPVIQGRLREAERAAADLASELAQAQAALAGGASESAIERLRILATRHPASAQVRAALDRAESAGRAATRGAARDRLARAVAAAAGHEKLRKLRDAAAAYRQAIAVDAESPEAASGLARVERRIAEADALLGQSRALLSTGDPEGALSLAEQAAQSIAGDPAVEGQLARARTAIETLRHEADRIRASIAADPDDDVLTWAQDLAGRFPGSALAAQLLRETQGACRAAEEKAADSRAAALLARARKLEAERQFERAAQAWEEAAAAAPSNTEVRQSLAALRARLDSATSKSDQAQHALDAGDPETALTFAEDAMALLPDQVRTAGILSAARIAIAEIARSEAAIETGPELDPERAEAQLERTRRLRARYAGSARCAALEAKALAALESSRAAARARDAAASIAAAQEALAEGRLADAERACGAARGHSPDDPAAESILTEIASRRRSAEEFVARGREAMAGGRFADALAAFGLALGADPGCTAAESGREAAEAESERIAEQVRRTLADAAQAERRGDARAALASWDRVRELEPGHPGAAAEIARLRERIERTEAAAAAIRAALDAGDPEAAVAAAQEARSGMGPWAEGDDLLRRARELAGEVERDVREIERDLGDPDVEIETISRRIESLSGRFPGSARVRDASVRIASVALERRRTLAASQVRMFVRERQYTEAVALAAEARNQGLGSSDLDAAESHARGVLAEVAALRARAGQMRSSGDLDGARDALAQVTATFPDDTEARAAFAELEEAAREFRVRIDAAESAKRSGDLTRSIEAYREALGINPGAPDLAARIEEAEAQRRRRTDLVRDCERAIRTGDGETCARTAKEILSLFPDDADARNLQTTGDALRNLVASLLVHARRQRELGETGSARITLECLLRVAPGHTEALALLRT